jgi:RNA polymerase sigma factor (TIGR02999 family)
VFEKPDHHTRHLNAAAAGDGQAADELLAVLYDELRKLAAGRLAAEAPGQTLQPTALVHEAWLRLGGDPDAVWENRAHFFGAAAEAMRRILVERARKRGRLKHGGEWQRVDWTNLDVAIAETGDAVIAVSEALDRLAAEDPTGAELIKLRFFGGLSNVDAARVLGLSERTAKRTWTYARAWLFDELKRSL